MAIPLITAAIGAIGTFLSAAGPAICRFGTALMAKLPVVLDTINKVVQIVTSVAQLFGVLSPDEDLEELGAKACQADKNSEDFKTNEAYINYLRNEVTLDHEAYAKRGDMECMAHMAAGVSVVSQGVQEKTGVEITPDFWVEATRLSLSAAEVGKAISAFGKSGDLGVFVDYLKGDLGLEQKLQAGEIIKDVVSELNPTWSQAEVEGAVQNMCAKARNNEWEQEA